MYQFRPRRVLCQYCEHSSNSHSLDTKKCTKCDCEMFEKEVSQGPRHRCGSCSHPPTRHENLGVHTESNEGVPKFATKSKMTSSNSTTAINRIRKGKERGKSPVFEAFSSSPDLLRDSSQQEDSPKPPPSPNGPPPARPARKNGVEPIPPLSPSRPLPTPPRAPPRSPRKEQRRSLSPPPQMSPSIPSEEELICNDPTGILLETNVILLCFSILSRDTFLSLQEKWGPAIEALSGISTPKILVGTFKEFRERDTQRVEVSEEEGKEMSDHLGCFGYVEVSSLRYLGFRTLAEMCLDATRSKKKGPSFTISRQMSPRRKRDDQGCLLM